jgi:hypothetical protein
MKTFHSLPNPAAMDFPQEESIVWDEDVSRLDYVREIELSAYARRRPTPWHGEGRRVGYTVLGADAHNDGYPRAFQRRLFFLKKHDRDSAPDGVYSLGAPCEAVDPRTIRPGYRGVLTDRAWGGPLKAAGRGM